MWSNAYYLEVAVHQMLAELCPFENFSKLLHHDLEQCILFRGNSPPDSSSNVPLKISVNVSGLLLLQFTSDRAEAYIVLRLQSTKY